MAIICATISVWYEGSSPCCEFSIIVCKAGNNWVRILSWFCRSSGERAGGGKKEESTSFHCGGTPKDWKAVVGCNNNKHGGSSNRRRSCILPNLTTKDDNDRLCSILFVDERFDLFLVLLLPPLSTVSIDPSLYRVVPDLFLSLYCRFDLFPVLLPPPPTISTPTGTGTPSLDRGIDT